MKLAKAKPRPAQLITEAEPWAAYGWMVESICERYGVTPDDILGPKRWPRIVRARDALCCSLHGSGMASTDIGRLLGRDHSTVLTAIKRDLRGARRAT